MKPNQQDQAIESYVEFEIIDPTQNYYFEQIEKCPEYQQTISLNAKECQSLSEVLPKVRQIEILEEQKENMELFSKVKSKVQDNMNYGINLSCH